LTEDLLAAVTRGSRVPLEEVKRHPHGALFADPTMTVGPKDDGWAGRFDVGNAELMADLEQLRSSPAPVPEAPFRLVSRRMMHVYNSSFNTPATNRGRAYNPAFMNPDDLEELGVSAGEKVSISSRTGSIVAVVESDPAVRRGCISMSHCFGSVDPDNPDDDVRAVGSSTPRLSSYELGFDRYSGQPRMSGIPVDVRRRSIEVG
jgi:anaerobic selenocysteine-containing dehydrogenase